MNQTDPQPQPPSPRMGWIAPDGAFYPCAYTAHEYLADLLTIKYYDSWEGEMLLEEKNWISLKTQAIICIQDDKMRQPIYTEQQKKTINQIIESYELAETIDPHIDWDKELLLNPEGYELIGWITMPTKGIRRSYSQELRREYDFHFERDNWIEGNIPKTINTPIPIAAELRYKYAEHPGD